MKHFERFIQGLCVLIIGGSILAVFGAFLITVGSFINHFGPIAYFATALGLVASYGIGYYVYDK